MTEPAREAIGGARAMRRLDVLGTYSDDRTCLTRLYLTAAHKTAASQVKIWMEEAGLATHMDAVGNIVGRYAGTGDDGGVLLIGSHIDTVRNAGKYDGMLGVVVAIEAVAGLRDRRERFPFAIEIIAFGDEEGVRFPVTLTGSKAISGTLDPKALGAQDTDGLSIRDALAKFGCPPDPMRLTHDRKKTLGYFEVHIEQGPVLESMKLPVGIVTGIAGANRARVTVSGTAGHAGTVPMNLRRDAAAAAAEMILAVERQAITTDDLVTTVGRIEVKPGAVNVIPAEAEFTIDMRSPRDTLRAKALKTLQAEFKTIAQRRRVSVRVEVGYSQPAAACDPEYITLLERATEAKGIKPFRLASGAGHDGLAMIALCPIAMLFVRCRGGISHNPAESVTEADVGVAIDVLGEALRQLGTARSLTTEQAKAS